jgi:hypothetical protein
MRATDAEQADEHSHPIRRRAPAWLVLCCASAVLSACADPRGRYDAFLERTAGQRSSATDAGGLPSPGQRFDFSGRYLLALQTQIAPATPLLFRLDASVSTDLAQIAFVAQALTTDQAPEPRMLVGSPVRVEGISYSTQGRFEADLGEVMVPGSANPISGSDIAASVQLQGGALRSHGAAVLCGGASGKVTVPISLDLSGSQFGAVLAQDPANVTPLTHCPDDAADGG